MKKITTTIAMTLVLAAGMTSCTKTKNTTTTPTPTTTGYPATMTAANFGFDGAGGTAFSAPAAGIVQTSISLTISGIQGTTKQSVSIVLLGATTTGTYDLDKDNTAGNGAIITKDYSQPTDRTLNYSTDNTEAGTGTIGGGKVVITKFTSTDAEGTFYIVAYNSLGKAAFVEQGKFSGKINKQ